MKVGEGSFVLGSEEKRVCVCWGEGWVKEGWGEGMLSASASFCGLCNREWGRTPSHGPMREHVWRQAATRAEGGLARGAWKKRAGGGGEPSRWTGPIFWPHRHLRLKCWPLRLQYLPPPPPPPLPYPHLPTYTHPHTPPRRSLAQVFASVSHNADGTPAPPAVTVPLPIPGLVSRRVLVMDFIQVGVWRS